MPVLMIEAKFPNRNAFNRGQFYRTILKLLGEQTYPQQMQIDIHAKAAAPKRRSLSRSASESNDDPDLRDAADAAMQQHGVRVFFVDEAHHLLYGKEGTAGSTLQEQLEWLKSLGSQTGVLYVLVGTYDLFNFGKLSGQTARRCLPVHFPRYQLEREEDCIEFQSTLLELLRRVPLECPAERWVTDHWLYFYECSIGCIGSDLAGIVTAVGKGVQGFAVGDEVIGFTNNRASQAEFVVVEASDLTHRPRNVSWEAAGSLFIAGTTAYAAIRAVSLQRGDTVAVSGAVGGVGSIVVQLAVRKGAKVIGLTSPAHHQWLSDHHVIPVAYGEGVEERLRMAADNHLDAFIDTYGADYVELALKLGVRPEQIDTIINFEAVAKYGVKAEGNLTAANIAVVADLVQMIDQGELEVPIARVYPLAAVREAYHELEQHHALGKIVLVP